jgi:hypothetical protein
MLQEICFLRRVSYQRTVTIAERPDGGPATKFTIGIAVKRAYVGTRDQLIFIIERERIDSGFTRRRYLLIRCQRIGCFKSAIYAPHVAFCRSIRLMRYGYLTRRNFLTIH